MDSFKKQCINFKKQAKEFGYNMKLTHIQEIMARVNGFENRHAVLSQVKEYTLSTVKILITTDDYHADQKEDFLTNDLLEYLLDNERGVLEMLIDGDYGPDSHTDILFNNNQTKTCKDIENYLEMKNKTRGLSEDLCGYSIVVDDKSFREWAMNNRKLLSDKGFLV